MHAFGIDLLITKMQFTSNPSLQPLTSFTTLNYDELLHHSGLTTADLLPFESLPTPNIAAAEQLKNIGDTNFVLDLGLAYSFIHLPHQPPAIVNL